MITELNENLDIIHAFIPEVERLANTIIVPNASNWDRDGHWPKSFWRKLGQVGVFGTTISEQYGGSNMGYLAQALIMESLSHASPSIGLSFAAHSNLCMNQIQRYGSEFQCYKWLPDLVSGKAVGALAISEHGAGSDAMSMKTNFKKTKTGYVLNGAKSWITNALHADVIIVYARDAEMSNRTKIAAWMVPTDLPGVEIGSSIRKIGMKSSPTSEVRLNQVHLDQSNLLGGLHQGTEILMTGLDYERLILSAGPLGIMKKCLTSVQPYLKSRQQFNQPIGSFQLMQGKLADLYRRYESSRRYLLALCAEADEGRINRIDAASVYLHTSEYAVESAREAIQCFGGMGYSSELGIGGLLNDAKLYEIGGGTAEIRRMLMGRELLKKDDVLL